MVSILSSRQGGYMHSGTEMWWRTVPVYFKHVLRTCSIRIIWKKTYFNRCSIPAIDISHTVPHKNSRLGEMYEVPTKMRCRTMDSFGLPKGASWHESINSVLLRLQQTGHDQKFYYRCWLRTSFYSVKTRLSLSSQKQPQDWEQEKRIDGGTIDLGTFLFLTDVLSRQSCFGHHLLYLGKHECYAKSMN